MMPARSLATAGLMAALGAMPAMSLGPVLAQVQAGQTGPMQITTDTPAYCLHLLDRVSDLVRLATIPIPHDVTDLTTEGQRMCANGQTRSGITRLRSALMIMEKGNGPAYR